MSSVVNLSDAIGRARRSPFYAQHLAGHVVNGRDDLARLPLTFKTHLRDATPFGMLAVPAHRGNLQFEKLVAQVEAPAAIGLGVPVVPVVCKGTAAIMPKGKYRSILPVSADVVVLVPIPTARNDLRRPALVDGDCAQPHRR